MVYTLEGIYVCMSVCQTITFKSLDAGSSYFDIQHISVEYRSSSYMKVKIRVTAAKKVANACS